MDKKYDIDEKFSVIDIDADIEDIIFLPSHDGKCRVDFHTVEGLEHHVNVEGGSLKIKTDDKRSIFKRLFSLVKNSITVYLPSDINLAVSIDADTGNVEIPEDFTFDYIDISLDTGNVICNASAIGYISIESDTGNLSMNNSTAEVVSLESETGNILASNIECKGEFKTEVDTGNVVLSSVVCKSFISTGDTGKIELASVVVTDKMIIKRITGDVRFDSCDADEVDITTDTGDVKGSFLTEKIIFATTDTGRVDIPKFTSGGRCDITTDTGDIKISINK